MSISGTSKLAKSAAATEAVSLYRLPAVYRTSNELGQLAIHRDFEKLEAFKKKIKISFSQMVLQADQLLTRLYDFVHLTIYEINGPFVICCAK
jgi:glycogen debranching enzyme